MGSPYLKSLLFFRVAIGILIVFEFLNEVGIWHVPLDFSWHGLMVTSVLVWLIVEILVHYEPNIRVPWVLPWIVLMLYMDALGDIFHFYSTIHPYDKLLHFTGSAVVTYTVYEFFRKRLFLSPFLSAIVYISIGSTIGMLYEIEEYLEDLFINKRLLRMGDSYDTGGDLLMNLLGCICIVQFIMYRERKISKEKSP